MNKFGHTFTRDQLQNKWKSLIRTYKSIKDNNNETGRNRKTWIFYEAIDKLLYKNPTVDPPVIVHNGKRSLSAATVSLLEANSEEEPPSPTASVTLEVSKRRKGNPLSSDDLLLKMFEQNQKHHDEDLQEKRKFNNLLEALLQKINK